MPIDAQAGLAVLARFPALSEPVDRLTAIVDASPIPTAAAVAAVEGDVALSLAVLRTANGQAGPWHGRVDSVLQAVVLLQGAGLREALDGLPTIDFLERSGPWGTWPEQMFRHAGATARAADRLAVYTVHRHRDRLVTAALLHDIGRLALIGLGSDNDSAHAAAGAAVLRAAGCPESLAEPVEHHHDPSAQGDGAYVHAADLLAHEAAGDDPQSAVALLPAVRALGLRWRDLRAMLFDLPDSRDLPARAVDPCPLSARELDVLERLAAGAVYKQIAHDLSLSVSTVRTHLHNIYGKLGAADRAQAVLTARRHGWV